MYACLTSNTFPDYYQYHRELRNHFYSDRLIYTEGVTVFKDDCDVPNMLDKKDWFQVDVITCAAPYIAKRKYTNKTALKALFKSRIQNVFEVAIAHDIEVLILGAFGCGAFKNPPEVVGKAFHEVIEENRYAEQFEKIVFAIKSEDIKSNYYAFRGEILDKHLGYCGTPEFITRLTLPSGSHCIAADFHRWQWRNKYFRKQFSILGDSISTLEGYNPSGYNLFYTGETCDKTGVHDMKDTWWGKVIDYFGGELLVNNSWSGSRVTKLPNRDTLFPSGCSDERTGGLHIGSVMPDVIIVYLGTNDWAYGTKVEEERKGFYDDKTGMFVDGYIQGDETVFSVAYAKMLANLKRNYPSADIFCCTLNETFMSSNPSFRFPHSHGGTHIEKYNEVIRRIARQARCKLIELFDNHIPYDAIDGTHPTAGGMNTLATLILRSMCDDEGAIFLDCDGGHNFVVAEDYTGGTKYVCKNCCKVKHEGLFTSQTDEINRKNDEYVLLPPDITAVLYSDTLRFTIVSSGETKEFNKSEVNVGRDPSNDYHLDGKSYIARRQATFLYERQMWFLRDNNSTNGTYINGKRLEPGKKYQLTTNDEISFAKQETVIFYKHMSSQSPSGDPEAKAPVFLEAGMTTFAKSGYKDETALKLIIAALMDAPLYFPVEIDLGAMLGNIDPAKTQSRRYHSAS